MCGWTCGRSRGGGRAPKIEKLICDRHCNWRNAESSCAFNRLLNSMPIHLQKCHLLSRGGIKASPMGNWPAQFYTLLPCQGKWPDAELSQSYGCRKYITSADSQCWAFRAALCRLLGLSLESMTSLVNEPFFFCKLHCESQPQETEGLISPSNQKNPHWKLRRRLVKCWLDSTAETMQRS